MDMHTMTFHTLGRRTTPALIIAATLLLGLVTTVDGQISVGVGLPSANIGINLGAYPDLLLIPGYPVYYDPRVESNYFFYDGMYWVYENDNWYSSAWYNGPWESVNPDYVPLFVLRVPVQYYRQPPSYFRGWSSDAPPRWGEHWGRSWEQHRAGWDRWDRGSNPAAAPLPVYQREYSKDRYPGTRTQQRSIQEAATGRNSHQPPASVPEPVSARVRPSPPTEQSGQLPAGHPGYQPLARQAQYAPQSNVREPQRAPEANASQNPERSTLTQARQAQHPPLNNVRESRPSQPTPEDKARQSPQSPPQARQTQHDAQRSNVREPQPAPEAKARQNPGEQRAEEKSGENRGGRE